MHKLEKLILESFGQIQEDIKKPKDMPKPFLDRIEKQFGPIDMEHDFFNDDLTSYMKHTSYNKTTGSRAHKVIKLASFSKMYGDMQELVRDIKNLMGSDDIRKDAAARELFELIRTNFRKLQRYLRTERPDQYAIIRQQAALQEMFKDFQINASLIIEQKELAEGKIVNESMLDEVEDEEEPTPEEEPDTDAPEETVLEDATDKILGRFPTVKAAIIKLQTEQFKEFVESIDWISPRPSSFRVNLKNGQDYILKWTGKTFEAQILGKKYILSKIDEYQQALDKLSILYKEAPMAGAGDGEAADVDTGGGGGGGGGEFPGEEGGAEGGDDFEADDAGGEEGGADLGGEEIDFEEPAEEPEA